MDVTAQVNERLCQDYIPKHPTLMDDKGCAVTRVVGFNLDWTPLNHVLPSTEEQERREMNTTTAQESPYSDPTSWFDLQLFVTSKLASEIRKHVFDELHYTCSAGKLEQDPDMLKLIFLYYGLGIAHNKVLAKLGSSRNKPNKQVLGK